MTLKKFDELPEQWLELRKVPQGGFFRLSSSETAPVWVRDEYDRTSRKYLAYKYDDVNHDALMKGSRKVYVGFIF